MPPQVLHVQDFEAGVFSRANDVVQTHNLAAGEYRAGNEQALGVAPHWSWPRNPMIQEQAVGSKQLRDRTEIDLEVSAADVLEHADGRNFVEDSREIAVVHLADGGLFGEPFVLNPLHRVFELPVA